jgi:hypothetical protein
MVITVITMNENLEHSYHVSFASARDQQYKQSQIYPALVVDLLISVFAFGRDKISCRY